MTRILVQEGCEVFNAKCECGEPVLSLYSDEMNGSDLMMDKKGWIYILDEKLFVPRMIDADASARSRCMECGEADKFWLQFRSGVLQFWSYITKHPGPSSKRDSEK